MVIKDEMYVQKNRNWLQSGFHTILSEFGIPINQHWSTCVEKTREIRIAWG